MELEEHLQEHLGSCHTIVVRRWVRRGRYEHLMTLAIDPGDPVLEACEVIMMFIENWRLENDQGGKFAVECILGHGESRTRRMKHIEVGHVGELEVVPDPASFDQVMLDYIQHCHVHILDQAKVISGLGTKAMGELGDSWRVQRSAMEERSTARIEMARAEMARSQSKEKDSNAEFIEMIKPLMGPLASMLASHLAKTNAANQGPVPEQAPIDVEAVPVAKPPKEPPQPDAKPSPGEDALSFEWPPSKTEQPLSHLAFLLGQTLRPEQWAAIGRVLGEAGRKQFEDIVSSQVDRVVLERVRVFQASLESSQLLALQQVLDEPQVKIVLELYSRAVST